MPFCPVKDFGEIVPVVHLVEIHLLDRRSGDDKSVVVFVFYVVETLVEHIDMLLWGVFRLMTVDIKQIEFDLQRAVGQQPEQICFGHYFERHEVENSNFERTNILTSRSLLVYHKNILAAKRFNSRKRRWNFYRHVTILFYVKQEFKRLITTGINQAGIMGIGINHNRGLISAEPFKETGVWEKAVEIGKCLCVNLNN